MADKRAFAKFDVGYLDNPKTADVFDASPNAIIMHFASVLYCAQHLTDGFIAERAMQRKAGATADDADLLVDAGLWHRAGHECNACPEVPEGKAYVHDFLEHNRSSDGVKRASAAAKKAAEARWEPDADGNAKRMRNPMPREREREREDNPSSPALPSMDFDRFWATYPRKVGKQAAIKAYAKAVKVATPQKILDGVENLKRGTTDKKFTPHPTTWLNEGRWDDEPVSAPTKHNSLWDQ